MNNLAFLLDGETVTADVEKSQNGFVVKSGENEFVFEPAGENLYYVKVNGHKHLVAVVSHKGKYFIDIDSMLFELSDHQADSVSGGAGGHAGEKDKIFAPMPGKVVKLLVAVGDEVVEKQPMVVVEAMKMENQVNSLAKGIVKAINFAEGDQVDTENPIIELELDE